MLFLGQFVLKRGHYGLHPRLKPIFFLLKQQLHFWQTKHGYNNKIKMDTKTRQKVTAPYPLL